MEFEIECKMRNILPEKSYTKCGGETSSRPGCRNMLKLSCRPLAFKWLVQTNETKLFKKIMTLSFFKK